MSVESIRQRRVDESIKDATANSDKVFWEEDVDWFPEVTDDEVAVATNQSEEMAFMALVMAVRENPGDFDGETIAMVGTHYLERFGQPIFPGGIPYAGTEAEIVVPATPPVVERIPYA